MRWQGERESDNVVDSRDGGSGGGLPIGGRSIGIGTVVIALVASYFLGVDPRTMLGALSGNGGTPTATSAPAHRPPENDELARFVSVTLASTEDTWTEIFRAGGRQYKAPVLHLFTGSIPTACGQGQAAAGPFYCPGDQQVYIDLRFYELMRTRFHAPGDFAQAYVIAHEVGHHVQNLLGVTAKLDAMRSRVSEKQYNAMSVKLELQADCFAGVWAKHSNETKHWLDESDIDGALTAAAAIGDDTLQKQSQGYVVPDSFTHGTSAQRVAWFKRGWTTGQPNACNTFDARSGV